MRYIITSILGLAVLFSSCTDLDTVNRRALSDAQIFEDAAGFENILFAAYESVNDFGYYGQQMMVDPEIMADNLNLVQFTGRFEGEIVFEPRSHISIWDNNDGRYNGINECNIVINRILDESVEEVENIDKNQLVAEALFLRALFYHDLAKVYGYEPGQEVSGWNTSVILRTEPTLGLSDANDRARSTNLEVYQQIEADLLQAIDLFTATGFVPDNPSRAGLSAAQALLARVYLYWGRYADAVTFAEAAMSSTTAGLVGAADYVASWNDANNPFHPESIFETEITTADWSTVDGPNESLHSMFTNNTSGGQGIIRASSDFISVLESEPDDVRIGLWVEDGLGFECQKWQGAKGGLPFLENIPIIRYSEMLLIAAEGKARSGNEPGAQADIATLRTARGLTAAVTVTGGTLIDLIMTERRKEFAAEGHRFFDLKRLGQDIAKSPDQGVGTLPYSDYRVLSFIPQSELELSAQADNLLTQNPGYAQD